MAGAHNEGVGDSANNQQPRIHTGIPVPTVLTRNKSAPMVIHSKAGSLAQVRSHSSTEPEQAETLHVTFKAKVHAEMKAARNILAKLKANGSVKSRPQLLASLESILENVSAMSGETDVTDRSLDEMPLCQICVNTAVRKFAMMDA